MATDSSDACADGSPEGMIRHGSWWNPFHRDPYPYRNCAKLKLDSQFLDRSVLDLCDCLCDQYLAWKLENLDNEKLARTVAIVFAAFTPVLLLVPVPFANLLGATTSAIAAIATGLLAAFGWNENHVRYGYTWHALQLERDRYLLRMAPDYDCANPNDAAVHFAQRLDQLVASEVNGWRTMMRHIQRNDETTATAELAGQQQADQHAGPAAAGPSTGTPIVESQPAPAV